MTKNTNYCQQFIEANTGVIVWIFNSKAIYKGIMTVLRGCCSRYFHRNSYRIALSVPPLRPSCSWKSSEHCHPLCTWIKAITWILLNKINWPAGFDVCASVLSVQSVCWFVFDPRWAADNDLHSVWSSTSLCGTPVGTPNPLREAMTSQRSNLRALLSLTRLSTNLIVPSMT